MIALKDLVFYESTHRYFYKGKLMIATTDVFKMTGLSDFTKIKWEVLEEAKLEGDYVHEMAKLIAFKELDLKELDYRLEGYHRAVKKFFKENVKRVIAVETSVCDPYNGYAGTPDIVYQNHKNRIVLADWKTPKEEHKAWKYQTAAYKNAWEKCFPKVKIQDRLGVMLSEKGTYEKSQYQKPQDFDKFLHLLGTAKIKLEEKITT